MDADGYSRGAGTGEGHERLSGRAGEEGTSLSLPSGNRPAFSFVYADLPGFCQTGSLPDPFDEKGFVQQHGAVCEEDVYKRQTEQPAAGADGRTEKSGCQMRISGDSGGIKII